MALRTLAYWLGFWSYQYTSQSVGELFHRPFGFIGSHVWHVRAFVAGIFFQHVCGNSEPVRAA
jgi:hypothetical protein